MDLSTDSTAVQIMVECRFNAAACSLVKLPRVIRLPHLSLFNCMKITSFHGPPAFVTEQKDSYLRVKLVSWAELAMRM